ncbi:chorismate-binding protein [Dokdonia sp. Hel_I_53]|uniref:chorismate-binding protein n=1 Tax=Dokdonia sp. Hel_I_53 TaxID=1566287 RepID=UPI0011996A93|nr:chorismate-binding protein [Dokdonia sp. Hel_I_53]TVZ53452.1 isochorismate synthase [Dokdonia sp. Hel_I_53]
MERETFFASLQIQFNNALPFVVYRKPNTKTITAFLQEDNTLYEVTDFTESGFVFAPFDASHAKTIIIPSDHSKVLISESFENAIKIDSEKASENLVITDDDYHQHTSLVSKAIDQISQGKMYKVVLSRKQNIPHSYESPLKILRRLLSTYSSAFVYCWYHPKVGLWLGATPETLLSIQNRKLHTMSLAGTQKFNGTEDVFWGSKENKEQQFVTDAIVKNLSPFVTNLNVSNAITHRAGDLLHIKTSIDATIDQVKIPLIKIITALHPTPAVCGLPREKAKEFILKNEHYERTFYTGYLGELNIKSKKKRARTTRNIENQVYAAVKKSTHLFVNLRCMEIDATGAQLYVGGGITEDSIPEDEWKETVNKLSTITAALK